MRRNLYDAVYNNLIGGGAYLEKTIVAEGASIGDGTRIGEGDLIPNDTAPHIYTDGQVVIAGNAVVPKFVSIATEISFTV